MKIIRWLNNKSLHLDSLVGWFGSTSHYVKVNNTDRQNVIFRRGWNVIMEVSYWSRTEGDLGVSLMFRGAIVACQWFLYGLRLDRSKAINLGKTSPLIANKITVDGYYHVITIQSSQPLVKPRTPVSVLQEPVRRERRSLREVSVLMQESRQMARSSISLTEKVAGNFPEQWKSFIEITFTQE